MKFTPQTETQIIKAAESVLAAQGKSKTKAALWDENNAVFLVVAFTSAKAKEFKKPKLIGPLAHPLFDAESTDVCLIIADDKQEVAQALLKTNNIRGEVITVTTLSKNFKQFEDKRKLKKTHDLFIASKSVYHRLPTLLGGKFGAPHFVRDIASVANVFKRLVNSTSYVLNGDNCSIRVGRTDFTPKQIQENVFLVASAIQNSLPQGTSIRSLNLKGHESPAFPFYNELPGQPLFLEMNVNKGSKRSATETRKEKTPKAAKSETPKASKSETPKASKSETPKASKTKATKSETPKSETPKATTPKSETPKALKSETPKASKSETPKASKSETPRTKSKTEKSETPAKKMKTSN